MAVPTDSNETFLREVDENLRRDQLRDFFRDYGRWLALALVLFLAAVGGWIYWQEQRNRKSAEQSEQLSAIFADIGANKTKDVPQRLKALEDSHSDIVRASALLAGAVVALQTNDRTTAIAKYQELADDGGMAQPYRDVAVIRGTALQFDQLKPEEVITRLQDLAKPGNPWFGSAAEMTAMAYLKQNKKAEAGRLFAAIAADKTVPTSLRSRAVQIAGTLGIDASASLPAIEQQD